MDLNLDRIKEALSALGDPSIKIPAIQIIGTNGKGSIASFLESALNIAGVKTGLTTSPHLVSWCERIRINGNMISQKELYERLIAIRQITKKHSLTTFEMIITTALDYFANNQVELIILEAGLGGRLDATTAHPYRPLIAVSSIGLDHCDYLGKSLREITNEKLAAIPINSKVISGPQLPEVMNIINEIIHIKNCTIQWVNPLGKDWKLGIKGDIQRTNAAVAKGILESLKLLNFSITKVQIRKGLERATWPGRLQESTWESLPILIDGAHNPHAAKALSKERNNWIYHETGVEWILGIQASKDGPQILNNLLRENDKAWIVPIPNHKYWNKTELLTSCPNLKDQLFQSDTVEEVLSNFLQQERWPEPAPVIAGSLYLIGDLLEKKIISI